MSEQNITLLSDVILITCVVETGKGEDVVKAARGVGAGGALIHSQRGIGIRERVGLLGIAIDTEKDVVTPPNSARNRFLFKGEKIVKMYNEVLRYCHFIPSEFIAAVEPNHEKRDKVKDLVLDWGVYAYQGSTLEDPSEVKFPFKCAAWGYVDGEIISPVDDAISPQRFINRVLSVTEANINNSGGSNTVIDEDALNPDDVADGTAARDIKQGKPIFIRSKGRGVPNMIGHYDNTPKEGVYRMFDLIPIMKDVIQSTTGVNEPLQGGEQKGSGTQLVGVTELLIQRGSLMQEPFYSAITNLFIQMYQHIATVGKRMYIDNERELAIITGDEGVEILVMSKDLANEDFRVFISRENDEAILKSQANGMLDVFLEKQLIDDRVYANLYNRSTPDDVTMALRSQAGLRIEAARKQAKAQAQAEGVAVSEGEFIQERERGDKINAQNQQERMGDKQIKGKEDAQLLDAAIAEDAAANSAG